MFKAHWLLQGFVVVIVSGAVLSTTALAGTPDAPRLLDAHRHYLGVAGQPEWEEFASHPPEGRELTVRFSAEANTIENTLFIRQDNVRQDWSVELNGRKLGKLFTMETDLVQTLPVPAGALRTGENIVRILPPREVDDIIIGEIKLDSRPLHEADGNRV